MNLSIILLVVHVMLALGIITFVLLQKGKGAAEGATFGGGGASTVFGASGSANFLSKTTAILATAFFVNSIALAYLAANRDAPDSVLESIMTQQQEAPAAEQVIEELLPPADDAVPAVDSDIPPPAE